MRSLFLAKRGIATAQQEIFAAKQEFAWKNMGASSLRGVRLIGECSA
jgi:hypothetical protein